MKIGIDARFYGEAGPGRYVSNLLKNLERLDRENSYVVFLKKSNVGEYTPTNKNFRKVVADYHWYTPKEQTLFLHKLLKERFDLVHFTQINVPLLYPGRFVVTVHDLILHEFSTERGNLVSRVLYRLKKVPYHLTFLKDVYASKRIIVPTSATKEDLLKHYRIKEQKAVVTWEGVDERISDLIGDVAYRQTLQKEYGISGPYIFYLGSFYPHKNVKSMLDAFNLMKKKNKFAGQLVLVGKDSPFSQLLANYVEEEGIGGVVFPGHQHSKGYLSDREAYTLFSGAQAFITTTLKEGFGIPPLEALFLEVPTVVSRIPSLAEICGDAVVYFDPHRPEDIAEKMEQIIKDKPLRNELVEKGKSQVKKFSWYKMAKSTLAVYQQSLLR